MWHLEMASSVIYILSGYVRFEEYEIRNLDSAAYGVWEGDICIIENMESEISMHWHVGYSMCVM